MSASGIAHLHVASGYSARYGASLPHALVRRAAERGVTALALTDQDTVAGTVRFAKAAAAAGIRPVFGVDLAVAPAAEPAPGSGRPRTPVRGGAHVTEARWRITLLAQTAGGWARLCRIVSAAHASPVDGVPLAAWPVLQEHLGDGLVVLLGPASEPVAALMAGRPDLAERLLSPWQAIAGPGLRLEAVHLGHTGTGAGSLRLAGRSVQLGDQLRIPVVVSNAVRYADPGQHRLTDVLDAARLLRPIDRRAVDGGERWLKGTAEMTAFAVRIAEAAGHGVERAAALLAETEETAASCTVCPVRDLGLGTPHFPEPHVVGADRARGGAMRLLRQRCEAGMTARGLDTDAAAVRQLEYELGVIGRLGYEGYFLAVAQVVADVRAMGIRVAARGSGAGSMVNHSLFVATANPLEHRLLFERFLSERRTSLPDIDVDVESARRLEVYDRIFERFGKERVAVTGMPETYRARHALRDAGLALGIAPQTVDMIAKSFPHIRACDIRSALAELPELKQLAGRAEEYGPLFEFAEGLDALVRGYAMHPCGVILSNATLLDRLPVQPTPGGDYPMVQADKEDVEDLGLLKLDVLGVRMQSAMAHAVNEIRRTTGKQLDFDNPDHVDLADEATFEMIRRSDTLGCFQIDSVASPAVLLLTGATLPAPHHINTSEVCDGRLHTPPRRFRVLRPPYGASHLHDLARRAAELGMGALADRPRQCHRRDAACEGVHERRGASDLRSGSHRPRVPHTPTAPALSVPVPSAPVLAVEGVGVLLVGDGFKPGGAVSVGVADNHGDVGHERGVGGAVPVLLAGRALDGLSGAHACDVSVSGADQSDAVGDVEGLAVGVGVPIRAGAGGEADQGGGEAGGVGGGLDRVEVDVAGEALGRGFGGGGGGDVFHGCLPFSLQGGWWRAGVRERVRRRSS
ncbi:PHP domain-containing protein [Streptomyces mirabilis]|uniref:PHP domain-containing protein n=1 Tax=Streptomyces mirabilis TaxID=68239 RepID=A0A1I2Y4T8_9ACTN|nr:PHP domain-containing protein [Streptomyces mirabilis]